MNISSRYIKLNAQFEIPEDLIIGQDYNIELNGSITACTETDDEMGGIERKYAYKAIMGDCQGSTGKTIPLKDPRRHSVKFRSMILNVWGEDYEIVMNTLLAHGDELKEWYEKTKDL